MYVTCRHQRGAVGEKAVCVPEQKFLDPTTGDEVVRVHWDFGLTSVDVACGGSLLTKITDIARLRATGFSGPSPDGGSLLIKLASGDKFEVHRNGGYLQPTDIDPFGHTPVAAGQTSLSDSKVTLDSAGRLMVNGQRMDRVQRSGPDDSSLSQARGWLLFFSIINTLGALFMGAAYQLTSKVAKIKPLPTSIESSSSSANTVDAELVTGIFDFLRGVMLVVLVFMLLCAAGSWVLWKIAGGPSARTAFTISKWIAVGYLAITTVQVISGVSHGNFAGAAITAAISGGIEFAAFTSFRKAQTALS